MTSASHENSSKGDNKNITLFIFQTVIIMETVSVLVQAEIAFSTARMGKVSRAALASLSPFPECEVVISLHTSGGTLVNCHLLCGGGVGDRAGGKCGGGDTAGEANPDFCFPCAYQGKAN